MGWAFEKIELMMSISMLISRFYYEKSALGEKVRNRIHRYNKIRIHFRFTCEVNPYFLFVKPKM